ncbi:hypothetical protein RI049_15640 [Cedecea neteri]|uniref:hypothetical protein n=1 Tax=Cedecea neteri TaxID=158822 RepID=UPI0005D94A44|nr:hypothetical protein [Cedecea neteri]AJZ88886.1 membrane protein [Klebsiella michiganensis]WPU21495.1 hypothetical protein RI049_15640 [Cedecea neteri]
MKKYSYPYLMSVTVLCLTVIFLLVWWHVSICRATFLNSLAYRYAIIASVTVSFFITVFLVSKGMVKSGGLNVYMKIFGGMSILLLMLSFFPVVTITYILPGTYSSYSAPYKYTSGSSKNCSGAYVDDPDLDTNIRICYPYGNYKYGNIIYIEKRSNSLGMVVTYAETSWQGYD